MRGRPGDGFEQTGDPDHPCWTVALLLLIATAALLSFVFHRFLSAGWLLSAWAPSALVGLSALMVVGVALKSGAPLLHGERLPRVVWLISALSAAAAWFFWAGRQIDWGDYLVHHHHALQLSLGRAEPSRHYIDAPHFYPPLAHHILALLHRLSGLSLYRVYALLTVALSALTPPLLWRLGRRWNLSKEAALFFALAVSLYGGLAATGSATHALPRAQLSSPLISRNLGLLLSLLMSLWWIRAWRLPGPLMGAGLGLILGLSALTHPNAALYAGGLTALWALRVLFSGAFPFSRRVGTLASLLPGASLALLFLFPFAETVSAWGGFAGRKLAMSAASPFDLRFVTIWPLAALTALPHWRRWPAWKRALAVLCFIYTVAAVAQSLWGLETERLRVLSRLHRFAPLFFILNGAFAVEGVVHLIRTRSDERGRALQMATLFLLGVSFQQACVLNAPKKRSLSALFTLPAGSQKAERLLADLRAHGVRPDKGAHQIEGVLLFPEKKRRGHRLAALSGLNVYFYHNQFIPFAAAEKKIASRRERRRKLRKFYRGLKAGRLDRRFLKRARVRYFYSDTKLSSAKHAVTRLFSWERGAIYRVDPPNQLKRAEVAGSLPSEESASSAKSAARAAQEVNRARERREIKAARAARSQAAENKAPLETGPPPASAEGEREGRSTEIEIDRRYPPPLPPARVGEALHPPASAVEGRRAPARSPRPAVVPAAAVGAALQVGFQQGLRAKGRRAAKAAPRRKTRASAPSKRRGARRDARTPSARRATRQRARQAEQRARIKRSRQAAARRRARRARRARQVSKRRGARDRTQPPRRRPRSAPRRKGATETAR